MARVLEAPEERKFSQEERTTILMTGQEEIRVAVNDIPSHEEMRSKA
jgi:hypothetical protein